MSFISSIFLGLIQGISEFLPISSSGHLSVFQNFFELSTAENGHMFFDVLLHLATLFSVCIVYRKDIKDIIVEGIDYIKNVGHPVPGEKKKYPSVRLVVMMFFCTLPLFIILPFQDSIEKLYYNTYFIGFAFLVTGCLLYVSDRIPRRHKDERNMSIKNAIFIGLAQALATVPGLSRSGTTITAGIFAGLEREFAVKFSFLISIPAILGANILQLADVASEGIDPSLLPVYFVGMLVAMVSGYLSINLIRYISKKGRFGYFSYYCWFAGITTIILSIVL